VRSVSVNAVTGSVLVIHELSADELARQAEATGLFHVSRTVQAAPVRPTRSVARKLDALNARLEQSTSGAVDLKTLAFATLTGLAGVQMVRGRVLPAAMSLLVYAARLLERDRDKGTDGEAEADG
jgi:hypothetical protein